METFTFKDDKLSIRPQAPPGGETHFNISDAEYGDKNIHHKYKRNNHPNNDINPPPNFVKREDNITSTPNGAAPVTGNRPSIKLNAPPGGFSNLDYYAEENDKQPQSTKEGVCEEPKEQEAKSEESINGRNSRQNSIPYSRDDEGIGKKPPFRPVYTPQAPPGGKSSISFNYDEPISAPKPKPKPNPEFQESSINNQESAPSSRRNSNTKQNNQSVFGNSFFNSKEDDNSQFKPYYAPQAPPGGKDSISLGFSESSEVERPHTGRRRNYENDQFKGSNFTEDSSTPYKPYYAPQAPPGGKDSISLGSSEVERPRTGRRRNYENDQFKGSNFTEDSNTPYKPYYAPQAPPGGKDSISLGSSEVERPHTGRRRNYENDQFKGSNFTEDSNTPYKPYYAPQAPPGGKDSISLGFDGPSESEAPHTGKRRNYNNDHFRTSSEFLNTVEDDGKYKPYYAPQAPPGGQDSISLNYNETNNNNNNNDNNNNTTSFSGRRRNYNAEHFKSSFGFNY